MWVHGRNNITIRCDISNHRKMDTNTIISNCCSVDRRPTDVVIERFERIIRTKIDKICLQGWEFKGRPEEAGGGVGGVKGLKRKLVFR